MRTEAITPEQKATNFRQRALALGADPLSVQDYEARGLQADAARQSLKKGGIELKRLESSEAAMASFKPIAQKIVQDFQQDLQANGVSGVIKTNKAELEKHFGGPVAVMGGDVIIGTGKNAQKVPVSQAITYLENELLPKKLESLFYTHMTQNGGFTTPGEIATALKSRSDSAREDRKVGIMQQELDAKKPLFAAQAAQANAHAQVYGNMLKVAKDNAAAGEAMAPYLKQFADLTPEEQSGTKGQQILLQAATAGAQKSKDIASIVTTLRKPDRAQVSAEYEKAAYDDMKNAGTDPAAIAAVKAKWPLVYGPTALDKAIADRQKGAGAKTTTAVPQPARAVDAGGDVVPAAPTALPQGYAVPNGRRILTTPSYGSGMTTPTFND